MIGFCRVSGLPAQFAVVPSSGPTPFESNSFDLIYAYSVFSHLSESTHLDWIREFRRILRPGGVVVLTTQARRFITWTESLRARQQEDLSSWERALRAAFPDTQGARQDYDAGRFVFAPTGGGEHRPSSFYGEAAVPEAWLREHWGQQDFSLLTFFDDLNRCSEPCAVMQLNKTEVEPSKAEVPLNKTEVQRNKTHMQPNKTEPTSSPHTASPYFSACGGLWIDRHDWTDLLERKRSLGEITSQEIEDLRFYAEHGYVIFPTAVASAAIDAYRAYFDRIWTDPPPNVWVMHQHKLKPLDPALIDDVVKVADLHYYFPDGPSLVFPPRVRRFLELLYERPPVIFQSMTTRKGTEEVLHQDTGPLGLTEPMSLAASWLALEDVMPGSGELQFVPGSHRVPEKLIDGHIKYHNGDMQKYHEVLEFARAGCRARGLEVKTFLAKKGDVLIWAADLLHGGMPITDPSITRRSLICHFMPYGVKPIFYDATNVRYVDYGNCSYGLDRFDASQVAAYNVRQPPV
jgi:phytanoyl-CoA hydroxylase